MKTVIVTIEGVAPYSQSQAYEVDRLQGEGFEDYEKRTWRNRMHVDAKGGVYIPPNAWKKMLDESAKYQSIPIPGKGKATYTKHFAAGVMVVQPAPLGILAADVTYERRFVPSDGRPGGGSRVYKYFPFIPEGWRVDVEFLILDETVLQTGADGRSIFEFVLEKSGQMTGIGRFRPIRGGWYGRFAVRDFIITEMAAAA